MLSLALDVATLLIGTAMLLNFVRLFRGPEITDRILALDTLFINTIALVALLGIRLDSRALFELGMLIALMGFIGTVAMGKYLLRGDVIE